MHSIYLSLIPLQRKQERLHNDPIPPMLPLVTFFIIPPPPNVTRQIVTNFFLIKDLKFKDQFYVFGITDM